MKGTMLLHLDIAMRPLDTQDTKVLRRIDHHLTGHPPHRLKETGTGVAPDDQEELAQCIA